MNEENPIIDILEDRVLTITINRPQAKNAITHEINIKLHEILSRAAKDDNVGAVILKGAGDTFCAGGDVKKMSQPEGFGKPVLSKEELLTRGAQAALLLHQMPKPTIALARGAAAGAGLSLFAGCDLRYADPSAKFTFAYTRIALSGDFGAGYLLEKCMGSTRAREFCLLCQLIDAAEAQAAGLVTRIFSAEDLENQVASIARELANGPSDALGRIKDNLNKATTLGAEEYIQVEMKNFITCRESSDHREALQAFLEKRKPQYH